MRQNINGLFNREELKEVLIPLPSLEIQQRIVSQINEELVIIEQNKRLIELFEQKITDTIHQIWIPGDHKCSVTSFPDSRDLLQYAARNTSDKFLRAVQNNQEGDVDE